jgi:hypothetical protein
MSVIIAAQSLMYTEKVLGVTQALVAAILLEVAHNLPACLAQACSFLRA